MDRKRPSDRGQVMFICLCRKFRTLRSATECRDKSRCKVRVNCEFSHAKLACKFIRKCEGKPGKLLFHFPLVNPNKIILDIYFIQTVFFCMHFQIFLEKLIGQVLSTVCLRQPNFTSLSKPFPKTKSTKKLLFNTRQDFCTYAFFLF